MAIFDEELSARQEVAQRYSEALAGMVEVPYVAPGCTSVWAQYSVLSDAKPALLQKLQEAKIPAAVYYPLPLHLQGAFAHLSYQKGDFPVSEGVAQRIFSLPMHPYLIPADQERICAVLRG